MQCVSPLCHGYNPYVASREAVQVVTIAAIPSKQPQQEPLPFTAQQPGFWHAASYPWSAGYPHNHYQQAIPDTGFHQSTVPIASSSRIVSEAPLYPPLQSMPQVSGTNAPAVTITPPTPHQHEDNGESESLVGRLSNTETAALESSILRMEEHLAAELKLLSLPRDRYLKVWFKNDARTAAIPNQWNTYEAYFNEHVEDELARLSHNDRRQSFNICVNSSLTSGSLQPKTWTKLTRKPLVIALSSSRCRHPANGRTSWRHSRNCRLFGALGSPLPLDRDALRVSFGRLPNTYVISRLPSV